MIRVFKFGGASVKDVSALENAFRILEKQKGGGSLLLVVSAMGKMTNALEELHKHWFRNESTSEFLEPVKAFHSDIATSLFPSGHKVFDDIRQLFVEIEKIISCPVPETAGFDESYDMLIPYGEILSSCILTHYVCLKGIEAKQVNACDYIQGDDLWREARIQWDITTEKIQNHILSSFRQHPQKIIITQGFIAGSSKNTKITLGREGSDFSASVFAFALDAESVTIWKDVPGLFNADPKMFDNVRLIPHLSFREAVELAYYGQSVIHPKTIKPLQNKNIPLYIKSFIDPDLPGSTIDNNSSNDADVPCFILKKDQMLISVSPKDFSFINEHNLTEIISHLAEIRIRMNVMQNSAISFSFCADYNKYKLNQLLDKLKEMYNFRYNSGLELVTIRNYNEQVIAELTQSRTVYLEQRSRSTIQFVAELKEKLP